MATLIALLISLLGYGTPNDFEHYTQDELQTEITMLEDQNDANSDHGNGADWDMPGVQTPSDPQ